MFSKHDNSKSLDLLDWELPHPYSVLIKLKCYIRLWLKPVANFTCVCLAYN